MKIIGDVHGHITQYWKLLQNTDVHTIQVGDFGFKKHHQWHLDNVDSDKHKILFGNHDYYPMLNEPHSLGDYESINYNGIKFMTIRGAKSIDIHMRTEGVDWFSNEELDYGIWYDIMDAVEETKPDIIISHTCPSYVQDLLFGYNANDNRNKSVTTSGLQSVFELHKPSMWIFGHHHISITENINGTEFKCLNELETFELK